MSSVLMSALIACLAGTAQCDIRDEGAYYHVSVCNLVPADKRTSSNMRPIYSRFTQHGENYFVAIQPSCKTS